jgi:uncharacterized repeat protein (TIGR01451 family)
VAQHLNWTGESTVKRGLTALIVLVCAAGWMAATAVACHSEIAASIDCNGVVSYTATAWDGSDATTISRTNSDVRVWVSTNGGQSFTQAGSGHFGKDNGFSFSGTYAAGAASSVIVKVQEVAKWGNGDAPAPARTATASKQGCSSGPPPPPPAVQSPAPALTIEKLQRVDASAGYVATPVSATVGQTVSYQLNVRNTGNVMLTVTVQDPRCDAGTVAPATGQSIGPTSTVTFTCTHLVTAADVGSFVNTATATGTAGNGQQVTGTATATAQVAAPPATTGVLGTTATVTKKTVQKKAVTKKQATVHKTKAVKHTKAAKPTKATKVTKKAKPARPVVAGAHFTG